jgi:hypothetical protein
MIIEFGLQVRQSVPYQAGAVGIVLLDPRVHANFVVGSLISARLILRELS